MFSRIFFLLPNSIELGCSCKLQEHFGQTIMVEVRGESSVWSRSGSFKTLGKPQHYILQLLHISVFNIYFFLSLCWQQMALSSASGYTPSQEGWLINMIDKCWKMTLSAVEEEAETTQVWHRQQLQTTSLRLIRVLLFWLRGSDCISHFCLQRDTVVARGIPRCYTFPLFQTRSPTGWNSSMWCTLSCSPSNYLWQDF